MYQTTSGHPKDCNPDLSLRGSFFWDVTTYSAVKVNLRFVGISLPSSGSKGKPTKRGHAVSHAFSRRLPTMAARVRCRVRTCGIYGRQSGIGVGFPRVFRFPVLIFIPPTSPHSSVIRGWYKRPISDRCTKWTQSHPTPRKKKPSAKQTARKVLLTAHTALYPRKCNIS
jgi:hypothetical protein